MKRLRHDLEVICVTIAMLVIFLELKSFTGVTCEEFLQPPEGVSINPDDFKIEKLKNEGYCIDEKDGEEITNLKFARLCAFEVNRSLDFYGSPFVNKDLKEIASHWSDVCVKFKGFQNEKEKSSGDYGDCNKLYCIDLQKSSLFWLIFVGLPIAFFVALITGCYVCCNFRKVNEKFRRYLCHGGKRPNVAEPPNQFMSFSPSAAEGFSSTDAVPETGVNDVKEKEGGGGPDGDAGL